MGRMAELVSEIRFMYERGFSAEDIAEYLTIPLDMVLLALKEFLE